MSTALTTTGTADVRPRSESTLEQVARRMGEALVAWSRRREQQHSREYLADLYERRLESNRLREEHTRNVTLARLTLNRIL